MSLRRGRDLSIEAAFRMVLSVVVVLFYRLCRLNVLFSFLIEL